MIIEHPRKIHLIMEYCMMNLYEYMIFNKKSMPWPSVLTKVYTASNVLDVHVSAGERCVSLPFQESFSSRLKTREHSSHR